MPIFIRKLIIIKSKKDKIEYNACENYTYKKNPKANKTSIR